MRTPSLAAVLVACVLAAAGCGDDDGDDGGGGNGGGGGGQGAYGGGGGGEDGGASAGGSGGATTLSLAADPGGALAFDKKALRAKPGKVTIDLTNQSQVPHAVEVEGNGVEEETDTITDSTAKLTVDLKAGEYKFYCPVDGHEQAGMVGTLTVR